MATVPITDVLKKVRQTYQQADAAIAPAAKQMKATCTKGCAGCCFQLVTVSFVEALTVADYLVRNRTLEELAVIKEKLRATTARLRFAPGIGTVFSEKRPCSFLAPGETQYAGTCSIYGSRPLTCRLHYVTSDPKLCAPETVTDCNIIDVRQPHLQALKIISGGVPNLASQGPLEPLVLHALELAMGDAEEISTLELTYWRRRSIAMLDHDRAVMERLGLEDKYVPIK